MNPKLLAGYGLLVLCLIVVALAVILVLMNTGDPWIMHVLYRDFTLSRAAWLLLAAGSGVVLWLILTRSLPRSISILKQGLTRKKEKDQERLLKQALAPRQEPASPPPPPGPTSA